VERYARGERAEAVAAVGEFTESDLKEAFAAIQLLGRRAAGCGSCPERAALRRIPLPAAVMLHADRHWLDRANWRVAEHGTPDCSVGFQQEMAERLAILVAGQLIGGQQDSVAFARRFHLAMVYRWHAELCLDEALRWAQAGLKWFPRDPELLVARGTVEEVIGTSSYRRLRPGVAGLTQTQRAQVLAPDTVGRIRLESARRSYEDALVADPGLAEARLRLGRVQWRLGQGERGQAALQAMLAAGGDASQQYLAHVFLGRIHEDGGRLPEAEREYRQALALAPGSQVAAVALGHVLQLAGDTAEARTVLREGLAHARRRTEGDAYWRYLLGPADVAESLFDDLRQRTLQ
jgi:tetratricopeptide (TPR) repeat protein